MTEREEDDNRRAANTYWRKSDPLRERLVELLTEEHQDWYTKVHILMALEELIETKVEEATASLQAEMERLSPGYSERRSALKINDNAKR